MKLPCIFLKTFFFPKYKETHFSYQGKELHLIGWVLQILKVIVNTKVSHQKLELGSQLLSFSAVLWQSESSVLVTGFCKKP